MSIADTKGAKRSARKEMEDETFILEYDTEEIILEIDCCSNQKLYVALNFEIFSETRNSFFVENQNFVKL